MGNLFYDSFTDNDDTLLVNHSPDTDISGNGWQSGGGAYKITDNKARSSLNSLATHYVNAGKSDVVIIADLEIGNATQAVSVIVRWSDANNYWAIEVLDGQRVSIVGVESGAPETWALEPATATNSILTVSAIGNDIEATYGETAVSFSGATHNKTVTNHGIRSGKTVNYFKNFTIDDTRAKGRGSYLAARQQMIERERHERRKKDDALIMRVIHQFMSRR